MQIESHTNKKVTDRVDPGNTLLVVYLVVVCLLILFGFCMEAGAQDVDNENQRRDQVRQGSLFFESDSGGTVPVPSISQNVSIVASGMIARVMVAQRFVNRSKGWIEATYVFPLPDESIVDHMNLMVGDRSIEGVIMEKKDAARTYTKAKNEGKKSSLLVQNRPNVFTTKVANIGPGEEILVEIQYQQRVRFDSGIYSLRFPMVVGPRYVPGKPALKDQVEAAQESTGQTVFGAASEWLEVSSLGENTDQANIPVQLSVDLVPGFKVDKIISPYHGIQQRERAEGSYTIKFTGEVLADRDFVLQWSPKAETEVVTSVFTETRGEDQYMSLMLMPPQLQTTTIPREMVFVLDISGSMAGTSIVQAKRAISLALSRLKASDRFNLIVFSNSASMLFNQSKPASATYIDKAQGFVDGLEAGGGTEMKEALLLALDGSTRHELLRQVVFLTDGAVANEGELFALINTRLGDSRFFTVGIGSAPNSYFMSRAASLGRGSFTYIGKQTEVGEKITELFTKIENPAITNLKISIDQQGADVEIYPSPLPDLYYGEPLTLALRSGWENLQLTLTGKAAGRSWKTTVDTTVHGQRKGVAVFWARKKIRSLMESLALGASEEATRREVVETALEHHLMSKYTSLVAVDERVTKPAGENVSQRSIKNHLPQGWQPTAIFAGGPQTATNSSLLVVFGCLFLLLSLIVFIRNRQMQWV